MPLISRFKTGCFIYLFFKREFPDTTRLKRDKVAETLRVIKQEKKKGSSTGWETRVLQG